MQHSKILIPVVNAADARFNLALASHLLPPQGKILALNVVTVPEEASLSEGVGEARGSRVALDELHGLLPDTRLELQTLVRVSRSLTEAIAESADSEQCDLLLLPWQGSAGSEEVVFGRTTDRLVANPPCNLLVARIGELAECRRILLPIRGGPYVEFALGIAAQLAGSLGGEITILHCEQRPALAQVEEVLYHTFVQRLRFHPQVKRIVTVRGDPRESIVHEATRHDLVIIGANATAEPQSFFLGPVVEQIAKATDKPLLVVKTPEPFVPWRQKQSLSRPKDLSERVDQWFAENTFHRQEFADLGKLFELKKKQGVTISLGLPALNEAESIANIIRIVKQRLFEEVPLLDEIVLIDSGSTDGTQDIAQSLGIPVFVHQDVLPELGAYSGKGEALWKSLHVLRGDIVAWVDTDIKNFNAGFIYGLLGPLLRKPEIQYVKGFYRRPLKYGAKLVSEGGGRVTELTVRPLFNLFYPELSGMIQPLAGEYAGRRSALERVPFFTGYGVETGLLIDLFNEFGLRAIAQVDLEERIHRNQTLAALTQMSFAILQVVMQRLQEKNRIELMEEINRSMKLIKHCGQSYALELRAIQDRERPPMISIPAYRERDRTACAERAESY